MQKQAVFKIKGMSRDLSESAFNSQHAYENMNMRIMATTENTLLSLVNEKGTKSLIINGLPENTILGEPVGMVTLNDEIVVFSQDFLFSTEDKQDKIYHIWLEEDTVKGELLYEGNLNFNQQYPIEGIGYYENENIKKIYWTDNLNSPRYINIATSLENRAKWTNNSFEFVKDLNLQEEIDIIKSTKEYGEFPSGVIQYVFTYYNQYGDESNIFKTSDLYYTSFESRGGSPEEKVTNSFKITLKYTDENFDHLRIYSIFRTSLDDTPIVKIVTDQPIKTKNIIRLEGENLPIPEIGGVQQVTLTDLDNLYTVNNYDGAVKPLKNQPFYVTESYGGYIPSDGFIFHIYDLEITNLNYLVDDGLKKAFYCVLSEPGPQVEVVCRRYMEVLMDVIVRRKEDDLYPEDLELKTFNWSNQIVFVDDGIKGSIIDPTRLLYIGGEKLIVGTLNQKDNTLFLGNIELKRSLISDTIKNYFLTQLENLRYTNDFKTVDSSRPTGYYNHYNSLKYNSKELKSFKYQEWYRFGVQFQHKNGKWSEPVYIGDKKNLIPIDSNFEEQSVVKLPTAELNNISSSMVNNLISNNYIKIRPVIVYPSLNDREVICQGILAPTVYNVEDRFTNSPFAQSSWFIRPNAPFDYNKSLQYNYLYTFVIGDNYSVQKGDTYTHNGETYVIYSYTYTPSIKEVVCTGLDPTQPVSTPPLSNGGLTKSSGSGSSTITFLSYSEKYIQDWENLGSTPFPSINSKWGFFDNESNFDIINCIKSGALPEFRHNHPIPSNNKRNAEIQCIWKPPTNPYISDFQETTKNTFLNENAEHFFIDQSILTFHSPDIEFDDSLSNQDSSSWKLRIVGLVPITSNIGDIDIQTSTPQFDLDSTGFYKETIGSQNISRAGSKSLMSGFFWIDKLSDATVSSNNYPWGFMVYPWHRNGSLNNAANKTDVVRPAMLEKKKLSNLKFSYHTSYYTNESIWRAEVINSQVNTGISDVVIFNSNEVSLVKIPAPLNSGLEDIIYYGNVDKIVNISRYDDVGSPIAHQSKKYGYPIIVSGENIPGDTDKKVFENGTTLNHINAATTTYTGTDSVRIKYKSSPHAVIALNYTSGGVQRVLPTIYDWNPSNPSIKWGVNFAQTTNAKPFWRNTTTGVSQEILNSPATKDNNKAVNISYGFLWMGELYNDGVTEDTRFGGKTQEALENNNWLPCGDSVELIQNQQCSVKWIEGDTFYQRYDHLKTYPFTQEDQNSVIDIISFMVETRINLDGRYDRNRGLLSNLNINPTNFNLRNKVYDQKNNFFNYRSVNSERLNLDKFPNTITWTLSKTAGELIDNWTNITLANVLDLDGDRGELRAIKRFNNELIAFQDRGISNILFNSRTQISTADGVPIEIANSNKVDGKRYISTTAGCKNKWSIVETPTGLYFIDGFGKNIYQFNGQLTNISDNHGFHSWTSSKITTDVWDPYTFKGFVTYYDRINKDVFFISKDECLAFSESLGCFTSFYNYEKVPFFANLGSRGFWLTRTKNQDDPGELVFLYGHNEGKYNHFFDAYKSYYTTVIVNQDPLNDKIFNTLEFRSDYFQDGGGIPPSYFYDPWYTFDELHTWNEYQSGKASLTTMPLNRPTNLKRKFNVWRANIPRDSTNKRDRMRSPWLYLKLMKKESEGEIGKQILHDLVVSYFI